MMSLLLKANATKTCGALSLMLVSYAVNSAEPIIVYGKLDIAIQQSDIQVELENSFPKTEVNVDKTTVDGSGTRLGVMGEYELNYNLATFYRIEYQVDTGDISKANLSARNQYVGLKGDFGNVRLGRYDTVLNLSQGKLDQFNDTPGDIKYLFRGDNRLAQTVTFYTPEYNYFKLGVTYVAESDSEQIKAKADELSVNKDKVNKGDSGVSIVALLGDSSLKDVPFFVSVAYDSQIKGYNIIRASAQGTMNDFTLGVMYQQQELDFGTKEKHEGYLISGAYHIQNVDFKFQYQYINGGQKSALTPNGQYTKTSSYSVGADYYLAKSTNLYAFYTAFDYDDLESNNQHFGVGLIHKF